MELRKKFVSVWDITILWLYFLIHFTLEWANYTAPICQKGWYYPFSDAKSGSNTLTFWTAAYYSPATSTCNNVKDRGAVQLIKQDPSTIVSIPLCNHWKRTASVFAVTLSLMICKCLLRLVSSLKHVTGKASKCQCIPNSTFKSDKSTHS